MTGIRSCLRWARLLAQVVGGTCVLTLLLGGGGGSIRITSPAPGQRLSGTVKVRAEVKGLDNVAYLLFAVDSDRPHSTNCRPYFYMMDTATLSDGPHTLGAEAYSRFGLLAASVPIKVIVDNTPAMSPQAPRALVKAPAQATPAANVAPPAQVAQAKSPEAASRPADVAQGVTAPGTRAGTVAAGAIFPKATLQPAKPAQVAMPDPPPAIAPVALSLKPTLIGDRALVMFRPMAEGMAYRVRWLHQQKTAVARRGEQTIEVAAGKDVALVCGKRLALGGPAMLRDNRLLVPAQRCAAAFGAGAQWDGKAHLVVVRYPAPALTAAVALGLPTPSK